jgi:hypothetical protein
MLSAARESPSSGIDNENPEAGPANAAGGRPANDSGVLFTLPDLPRLPFDVATLGLTGRWVGV